MDGPLEASTKSCWRKAFLAKYLMLLQDFVVFWQETRKPFNGHQPDKACHYALFDISVQRSSCLLYLIHGKSQLVFTEAAQQSALRLGKKSQSTAPSSALFYSKSMLYCVADELLFHTNKGRKSAECNTLDFVFLRLCTGVACIKQCLVDVHSLWSS